MIITKSSSLKVGEEHKRIHMKIHNNIELNGNNNFFFEVPSLILYLFAHFWMAIYAFWAIFQFH